MRLSKKFLLIFLTLLLIVGGTSRYFFVVPDQAPPELNGVLEKHALDVDGVTRTFDYYLPANLHPDAPVVLAFHGSRGSGQRMRRATAFAFDLLADQYGIVIVYPDGYQKHWNDCRASGSYAANDLDIDDPAFVRTLLAYLKVEYGVDTQSVLAIGLSNGGHMSYRLAMEAPDLIRAAVAIAASMPADDNLDCKPSGEPIAVMIVNGTEDPINPYDGGEVTLLGPFGSRGNVESSADSAAYWAGLAGHTTAPFQVRYPDIVPDDDSVAMLQIWTGHDRPAISLITVFGGGHTIPHPTAAFPRIFGTVNRDFVAADEAWRFFERERERPR